MLKTRKMSEEKTVDELTDDIVRIKKDSDRFVLLVLAIAAFALVLNIIFFVWELEAESRKTRLEVEDQVFVENIGNVVTAEVPPGRTWEIRKIVSEDSTAIMLRHHPAETGAE